jgi:putative transport protein
MDLLNNSVFLLFLIIILGEMIGQLEFKSFSFGSSAIIFVAILMGHFGYVLPKVYQTLGLVLFIYSIGLQAGPGFISSFKGDGLKLVIGASFLVFLGFLATLFVSLYMGYNSSMAAGIFSGALTSTPGLAVAVEMTGESFAPAAYGVTYSFGVIGIIIFIKLLPILMKLDLKKEDEKIKEEIAASNPKVIFRHLEINNPNIFGHPIKNLHLDKIAEISITRLMRKDTETTELVMGETILHEGDKIRVVGTEEELDKVELFMGKRIEETIQFQGNDLIKKKVVVSKKEFVGKTLGIINFRHTFNVQVARMTRNDLDIPATADTHLQLGDILHLVGNKNAIDNVKRILGDDVKTTYTTNALPILIGIFFGFLSGEIPIHLPGIGEVKLGITGGVLAAGLILGYMYNFKTMIWRIPETSNRFIRELGLMLFLAAVGTSAGETFVSTLNKYGLSLFLSGVVVTLVPLVFGFFFCQKVLKIQFIKNLGVLTGGMTSTPGLATASSLSDSPYAASSYATVYPVALVGMIVFTKLLVLILNVVNK